MDKDLSTVSLEAIGGRLKKAREAKALSIDQVQKQTRMYSTILVALEEGRCDEILPSTYVKSFLKKYSQFLGIDPSEMLKAYVSLHPEESTAPLVNILETKKSDAFSKFIYVISVSLLLIAIIYLMTFLGKKSIGVFKKQKAVKTAPVARAKPITRPKVQENASQALIPKQIPLSLTIKMKRSVMVGVKKDGVVLFKRVIPKGSVETITASDNIELYIAKADAVELTLNGKRLALHEKGVVKNFEITRKGIRAR